MISSPSSTDGTQAAFTWICTVLGGAGSRPSRPYLVRPGISDPQLVLPMQPRAAARSALRRNHDDRSLRERAIGLAGEQLATLGALALVGGETHHLPSFKVVEELATALGEAELIPAIGLGPPRRNRKPVIQLLRPDGITVGFAKVGWSRLTKELINNESEWLRRVDGRLPPTVVSPAVLHRATIAIDSPTNDADELTSVDVVVTAPLRTSLFSRRRGSLLLETTVAISRLESSGLQRLAEVPMIEAWRASPLADVVDLDLLIDRHGSATVEFGMWHGDLTPWNTATVGGVSSVWDWEFADRDRPVGFDALHLLFESERRAGSRREEAAIDRLISEAPSVLGAIKGPPVTSSVDAVTDLYLCELLARESRLAGEGWKPEHLGPLDEFLQQAIHRRLNSL